MNINIQELSKTVAKWCRNNATLLLTIGTGLGLGTTVVLTRKAAIKEIEVVKEKKPESKLEYIKAVSKYYIPPFISAGATLACAVSSEVISSKKISGLTAAYEMSESAMKLYKEKVIEEIGANKEKKIEEKVAVEKVNQAYANATPIIVTGDGDYLYLDAMTERPFKSNKNAIDSAILDINCRFHEGDEDWIPLNDFYASLHLPYCELGRFIGFDREKCRGKVEIKWSYPQYGEHNEPMGVIGFDSDSLSSNEEYRRRYR